MKKINFYLRKNHLSTTDENKYMAQVVTKPIVGMDELVEIMMGKNTTVTRQDMIVVLDLFKETVMEQILSGYPVKTNLFKTNVSIKGGFADTGDEYDKERHTVCANMAPIMDFRKELAFRADVEQVDPSKKAPFIRQVFDYETQEFRLEFNAGALIGLRGNHFSDEEKETRVYFNLEGSPDLIPAGKIHQVKDRYILCSVPEGMAPGNYEVTVIVGEGNKPVQGSFEEALSIS